MCLLWYLGMTRSEDAILGKPHVWSQNGVREPRNGKDIQRATWREEEPPQALSPFTRFGNKWYACISLDCTLRYRCRQQHRLRNWNAHPTNSSICKPSPSFSLATTVWRSTVLWYYSWSHQFPNLNTCSSSKINSKNIPNRKKTDRFATLTTMYASCKNGRNWKEGPRGEVHVSF